MRRRAGVVSIHDVTPETLLRVLEILELIRPWTGNRVALLVVPGKSWSSSELTTLRRLAREGLELAGHGWIHRGPPRSLWHRIHGLLISRDQAEHLSRTEDELVELVTRGARWFQEHDLPAPTLYVPPAWALGALRRSTLRTLPYRWYEVLRGFVDAETGRLHHAPLVGYEADTWLRKAALRANNRANRALARGTGRPLRIAVHPRDLELLLAADLRELVADRAWEPVTTRDAMIRLGAVDDPREGGASGPQPSTE